MMWLSGKRRSQYREAILKAKVLSLLTTSHHGNERGTLKLLNILYCVICDAALLQVSTFFTEDYFTKHYESVRNILEYLAHHLVRNIMCAHDFWLEMPLRISEYVDNGNIVGSINYAFYAGHK